MNIYEKLLEIQTKLKAPKNQRNNFGNYNYRSCEDILEAVKPHLLETKTVLTISDVLENIGNRYYIKAVVTLNDTESEINISVCAYAREEETKKGMDGSQITGASSSYARKYALNGLFAIDDTKDSDGTNEHDKTPPKLTGKPTTHISTPKGTNTPEEVEMSNKDQITLINTIVALLGGTSEAMYKAYKINSYEELTKVKADKVIEALKEKAKEKNIPLEVIK